MKDKVKMTVAVVFIAVVAWLFAEAESLGEQSVFAQVRVVSPDDMTVVETLEGWEGKVLVQLRGSQGALNQAKTRLGEVVEVIPGITVGVDAAEGRQPIRLLDLLGGVEELRESGVTVVSTSPISVEVEITTLTDVAVGIEVDLGGVQVEGAVTTTPAAADVRMPSAMAGSLGEDVFVVARFSESDLAALPDGGSVKLDAVLSLPDSLVGHERVLLLTKRVSVAFDVRSTLARESVSAPVQILLPSVEQDRWRVRLGDGDDVLRVRVVGPSEVVRRITSGEERLVAVLALSSDDLAAGVSEKEVSFSLLRDGVLGALAGGLKVEAEDGDRIVGVSATRVGEEAADDG